MRFLRWSGFVVTSDLRISSAVDQAICGAISRGDEIAESIVYNVCTDFSMPPNVFPPNWLPKSAGLVTANTE